LEGLDAPDGSPSGGAHDGVFEHSQPLGIGGAQSGGTRRYEEEGEAGLVDRRLGQASGRRVPSDRAEEVERLYRERYQDFTVKHFHEHLVKDHGFGWGYTWLKLHLQWAGVVPKAPRKGAHRRKRERRPLRGMMLHQDGSRHAWLEGQPALDLIVTLDDATGAIYSAFLIEEEGTASTFRALNEVFSEHGLPMSLYTDRGAHYFRTPKAGEIDRGSPTQVARALAQLGVEHIGAFPRIARRETGVLPNALSARTLRAGLPDAATRTGGSQRPGAPLNSAQRRTDLVDMWTTLRLAHIPTGTKPEEADI
jgi:hypothetical protein